MALVKLTEDTFRPHPTREGASHLVGRKGQFVDEALLNGVDAPAPGLVSSSSVASVDDEAAPVDYESMKVAELKTECVDRGFSTEDADGKAFKKQDLVEMLELDDERRGA